MSGDSSVQYDKTAFGRGLWDDGTHRSVEVSAGLLQYLMYPWHVPFPFRPDGLDTFVHLLLEFIGCWLLGWWVLHVKSYADASLLVDSAIVATVYALTFRMAWGWSVDYSLRRHLNWAITMGYSFVGKGSALAFILYGIAQFTGAGLGGLTANFFGAGSVADYSSAAAATTDGQAIFINIWAGFLIVYNVIYNEVIELRGEEEHENHKRVGNLTAIVIFLLVTVFFRHEHYSFGNVVYFASISSVSWSSATTNLAGTGLIDYGAELGFPLVGAVGAIVVFYIAHWFIQMYQQRKLAAGTANDPDKKSFIQTFVPAQVNARTFNATNVSSNHALADDGLRKRSPLVLTALRG